MSKNVANRYYSEIIRDSLFVRNLLIVLATIFIMVGVTLLYFKGELIVERYQVTLDIAIGTIFGNSIFHLLSRESQ